MNKSQITTLALNLLSTDSRIRSSGIYVPGMKPCILCKQKLISHPDEPIKEFTMATCGCLYHQKCLEGYLLNIAKTRAKLTCPNWDCKGREIETLITQDLFKEMDKPTTLTTEDTASKQVYSENPTPVGENADKIYMNQLGLFSGEEQSSSKTAEVAKETSDQATSPIEVVSTTPGNSENVDAISQDSSGQIQRPICEKCSEDITIDFQKDTVFLSCSHAVHLDCINDLRKRCPTCPSSDTMSEISTLVEPDPSDAQKKRTRESSASTEKSSSKKAKKTGGKKKVSSTLKQLIEELLTDIPDGGRSLEEIDESASNFLQLSERIDHAETKNKEASRGLIFSYFNFGEAVFKRYKELKPEFGKDGSEAIVKKEVRVAIPETKCSDEALRKKTERSEKVYKLFNTIGKEKIARIRSIPPSFILNLTADETKYVMAEILTHKV